MASAQNPTPPPEEESSGGNKIGEILEMLSRRAFVVAGVASIFIANAAWKLSQQPTTYSGNIQMLIEPANGQFTELDPTANTKSKSTVVDYSTQLSILASPPLLAPVVEELQDTFPDFNFGTLLSGLQIKQIGETSIIQVDYSSTSQTLSQAVLDELSANYLDYSLTKRQTYLRQGLAFVNEQLNFLQTQVDEYQDQLQVFRQDNSFVEPEDRSAQLIGQLTALDSERLIAQQALANLRTTLKNVQTEAGVKAIVAVDPGYQEILTQIRTVDAEISQERARFQDENIVIRSLKQRRDNLLPLLDQQAKVALEGRLAAGFVEIQSLEGQLQNIDTERARIKAEIQGLPLLIRDYNNLARQQEIAQESLNGFLQSRQTLQIQSAQSEIPWEVIREPRASAEPSSFAKELLNKIIMGIALGVAVAFALDKLDGSFHTVSALQRKIKLPILGILPFNQQVFLSQESSAKQQKRKRKLLNRIKQQIIRLSHRFSSSTSKLAIALFEEYDGTIEFFESLRVIHTNVQQLTEQNKKNTFVVSSATVGDGKTTVAINWADTAAVMGQKVLLIDANFRRPEIHEFLNLRNDKGLNNLLSNPELDPSTHIQKVFEGRELYLLAPGITEEQTSAILTTERLTKVLEKFRSQFDLIIVDVPSILGLADASILSRCTDGLILVTSLHKTPQSTLKEALDELESKQIPVLGLVANRQKGATPVLRATISQSNVQYFPDAENTDDDISIEPQPTTEQPVSDPQESETEMKV
ncbi:MAG: polysaccharide biosynthesis tyrosine autokinase [Limnothrix sp.]